MIAGALVAVFLMVEGDAETAGVLLVIAAKFVADVRYAEFAR